MDDDEGTATEVDGEARTVSERPLRSRPTMPSSRYRPGNVLGRGGMGEVIEAFDDQIGRDVAIKRMRAEQPGSAQVERFLREARIQGRLEHPAILPVHEIGRDPDGLPYFAMKKLAGTTLSKILASRDRDRYPRQRLLRAFADVCLAIELAHSRGVIHRDLKPDNLALGDFGETYVLDWGIAKLDGDSTEPALARDDSVGDTGTGSVVGTAGYMAPEQARGDRDIGPAADIYALGCVLFEILAEQRLHPRGATVAASLVAVDARPSVRAPELDIPPELDDLCVRATALDPASRIPSARALGEGVQRYLDGDRDLAQRKTLALAHLERATAAIAVDDRRTAMREAGRALALDPTLHRAGDLVAQLLLEPPREVPLEVQHELGAERTALVRRNIRTGVLANLGYLLFVPLFALAGIPLAYGIAIAAFGLVAAAVLWSWRKPDTRVTVVPLVLTNAANVVMIGLVASPFLFGIALASASVVGFAAGPLYSRRPLIAMATVMTLAVLVPWLAEVVDLLPRTTSISDGALHLTGPLFASPTATYAVLVLATIAIVAATLAMAHTIRHAEATARERVHLQSWQLRQLVAS